jgi:hypothetical protein
MRIADLSGELRQQRLLLEARAQSDVGRHDLALDGFMREMKARFPDASAWTPPLSQRTDPGSTGVLPAIVGMKRAEAAR